MGLTVSQNTSGGDFEICPQGSFIGRCYSIVDLGTQKTTFQGETKEQHKVVLTWELLDEDARRKDGTPHAISKTFTASLDPKSTLRKTLDAWRGRPFTEAELNKFELSSILGAYASIGVTHEPSKDGTKTYSNLTSVAPLHKSMPKPTGVNPDMIFDLDQSECYDLFSKLPKWLQAKVEESKEWGVPRGKPVAPAQGPTNPVAEEMEEMPF